MMTFFPLIVSTALMMPSVTAVPAAGTETYPSSGDRGYAQPGTIKLVIDLNTASPGDGGANPGLAAVESLVAEYGARRPHPPKVDIVVVLHAKTANLALGEEAARRRGAVSTADRTRMKALSAKGVRFVVSRQSLVSQGIGESELLSWVGRGPNSSMIFLDLEAGGYIFDTAKSLGTD